MLVLETVLHPSLYPETGATVALEAMGAGCLPVFVKKGSLPELISEEFGFLSRQHDIYDERCIDDFVHAIFNLLSSDLIVQRERATKWAFSKFDYKEQAKKFIKIVE